MSREAVLRVLNDSGAYDSMEAVADAILDLLVSGRRSDRHPDQPPATEALWADPEPRTHEGHRLWSLFAQGQLAPTPWGIRDFGQRVCQIEHEAQGRPVAHGIDNGPGIAGGYSWECPSCGQAVTSWTKPPTLAAPEGRAGLDAPCRFDPYYCRAHDSERDSVVDGRCEAAIRTPLATPVPEDVLVIHKGPEDAS